MVEGRDGDTNIAAVASLIADPTRAAFLIALCDGRSLPAGELARIARVAALDGQLTSRATGRGWASERRELG